MNSTKTWTLLNPENTPFLFTGELAKFNHFHTSSRQRFKLEFMTNNFIVKNYSKEERAAIENKLTADLKDINFYHLYNNEKKPLNQGNSDQAYKENYSAFCNFVYGQLGIKNTKGYKTYVDRASGRKAAKELSRNVVGKIKAYHNKYHGKGPKSFVDDVIASIENYNVDENKSDNYELFLAKKLQELENKENEYYQKRVPSCFSCFTFFYKQRSSLQPLIDEAKKMVAEYKKQNEPDFKNRIPSMAPKK